MKINLAELLEVAKPLIKYLNDNCHPHCTVIVDCDSVELVEGVAKTFTDEFIKE